METAFSSRGGWFAERQTSTGACSGVVSFSKYILVAGLLVCAGTGALSDDHSRLQRSRLRQPLQVSSATDYIAEAKYVRTPVEDLQRIREIIKPAVSDLAKCFKVSRQAIYNWQNGEQPSDENTAKLNDIALAADMFAESGRPLTGYILKRKIINGKSLFEAIQDGRSAVEATQLMLDILEREAKQRELLSARFAGRSVSQGVDDSDIMPENDRV
jgi:hypothetical protein